MTTDQVTDLKAKGNAAFSSGQFAEAITHFSSAISLDPSNHVLYSNRSAAYASMKDFDKALEDADKCISLKADWPKGYSRRAAAYVGLGRIPDARSAYEEGLRIDPGNAVMQKGLHDLDTQATGGMDMASMLSNIFKGGNVMAKIGADRRLAPYLLQADYRDIMEKIQANPELMKSYMGDERIMRTFLVLMGLDVSQYPGEGGSHEDSPMPDVSREPPKPEAKPVPKAEPEPEPLDPTSAKVAELKAKGTVHYKKKEFDEAIRFYEEAWEASGEKEITLLTNKAAVLFEMGKFEEVVQVCQEAVDKGRELRADFKIIAKAFGRMGKGYEKLGQLDEAMKRYSTSLTEHRTADILDRLKTLERQIEEQKKKEYLDPAKGEEAREKGNDLFKKADFAGAVKQYSEAVKRNPDDVKAYSNRAACYTKLGAIPEAIKDCNTCITLDPSFVKPYLRKAQCHMLTKEYNKAVDTLTEAKKYDTEGKHTYEIDQAMINANMAMSSALGDDKSREEVVKKAMQDPEIQAIIADPAMQSILQSMETDPRAAASHMRDPKVAANLRKLVNAGIVRMGP